MILPLILWYKILSYVVNYDNLRVANKYFNRILTHDDFWRYKTLFDYPELVRLKPDHQTYGQWYYRISKSGDLYFKSHGLRQDILIMSNINQCKHCCDRYYFIDIFSQLWYHQIDDLNVGYYGEYYRFYEDNVNYMNIGTWLISNNYNVGDNIIKIMDNVKMIHPTSIGDFILFDNDDLYFLGLDCTELILQQQNIKFISGTESLCFYIDNQHQLFYYHNHLSQLQQILIASRVKYATGYIFAQEDPDYHFINKIYFEDLDNKYWLWDGYTLTTVPTLSIINEYLLAYDPSSNYYIKSANS